MLYRYAAAALVTGTIFGAAMPVETSNLQAREVRDLTLFEVADDRFKDGSIYTMHAVTTIPTANANLAINPSIFVRGAKLGREGTGFLIHNVDIDGGNGCMGWNPNDGTVGYSANCLTGWPAAERVWNFRCAKGSGVSEGSSLCSIYHGDTVENNCVGRDAEGRWLQKRDCSLFKPTADQLFQITAYA